MVVVMLMMMIEDFVPKLKHQVNKNIALIIISTFWWYGHGLINNRTPVALQKF